MVRISPHFTDVKRERGDQFDHVLGAAGVELAAALPRIDEGAYADPRDVAGPARRDVAKQMGDDALRQIIRLDLI